MPARAIDQHACIRLAGRNTGGGRDRTGGLPGQLAHQRFGHQPVGRQAGKVQPKRFGQGPGRLGDTQRPCGNGGRCGLRSSRLAAGDRVEGLVRRGGHKRERVPHGQGIAFCGHDAHKAGGGSLHIGGGLGGLDGKQQGVFFDLLALFGVHCHDPGFGLIGIQQRYRHRNLGQGMLLWADGAWCFEVIFDLISVPPFSLLKF